MDEVHVNPEKIRGLGNVISVKNSTDFNKYTASIMEIEDNMGGLINTSFKLSLQEDPLFATVTYEQNHKAAYNVTQDLIITLFNEDKSPVKDLKVDCYLNNNLFQSQYSDNAGKVTFPITPSELGDLFIKISVQPQYEYDNVEETLTVPIGGLIAIQRIITSMTCEDDEIYVTEHETPIMHRSQLNQFVKDIYVADGGEVITDENNITSQARKGDLIVTYGHVSSDTDYYDIIFEDEIDELMYSIMNVTVNDDNEIIVTRLEEKDIF